MGVGDRGQPGRQHICCVQVTQHMTASPTAAGGAIKPLPSCEERAVAPAAPASAPPQAPPHEPRAALAEVVEVLPTVQQQRPTAAEQPLVVEDGTAVHECVIIVGCHEALVGLCDHCAHCHAALVWRAARSSCKGEEQRWAVHSAPWRNHRAHRRRFDRHWRCEADQPCPPPGPHPPSLPCASHKHGRTLPTPPT